jgi:MscS family membrane protein
VWVLALGLTGWLLAASAVWAQEEPGAPAQTALGPADDYGRGVPRSAMLGYLEASRAGDYERAARYLDLRRFGAREGEQRGPELARQLKIVLDRTLWVDLDALSAAPEGHDDDGLPRSQDLVGILERTSGPARILLQRVPREDGVRIWQVAPATVAAIPELYAEFGYGVLEQYVPQRLLDLRFLELALWQWTGLLLALFLAWLLSYIGASVLLRSARPLVRRSRTELDDHVLDATAAPLRLTLALLILYVITLPLGLPVLARDLLVGLEKTIAVFSVAWLLFRLIEVSSEHVESRLQSGGQAPAARFVPLGQNILKVIIVIAALLAAVDSFGYNVWGFVASLGVAGIAVALAAQKSIENFFGGVFLIVDEPVRIGDFCRFGGNLGVVEEIGLRSTRVRTLDRTVVTIPNAEFSSLQIENFTRRDRIRFHIVLGLRYETTPDQMRHVLAAIRRLLLAHPRVDADPARVRFVGLGAYSLDLEIFSYVNTANWDEFLAVREDLLLRLMDIVEESGSGFAFPSQTNYVAPDGGLDTDKTRLAEDEVRALREKRELPLPDYPEATRTEITDTLDYPEKGSALRRD